jgi:protein TonB
MKNILSSVMKLNLILFLFCSTISLAQNEDIDVSFAVLDDVPRFPNCLEVPKEEAKNCFIQEMKNHIQANFSYPKKARRQNIQDRITVLFTIDKDGNISNIKSHALKGGDLLIEEAERIIKLLPKFKPAIQRGKAVGVSYAQPINFKLN